MQMEIHRAWQLAMPLLFAVGVLTTSGRALAQPRGSSRGEVEIPPPEDVELSTKDGLLLGATYFGGTEGKDTTPVILLHDFDGQRGNYLDLARRLQNEGFAVIVPDLRGHGQSTEIERRNGTTDTLTSRRLSRQDLEAMVLHDVETVKRYLVDRNNAEELNIDKLAVVGAGLGAVVGVNWTALDWSWPVLATGKQGQDVKAVVLISPPQTFRGLTINNALETEAFRRKIAVMVAVGRDDRRAFSQAKRIFNQLERDRSEQQRESLDAVGYETSLQGMKLFKKEFSLEDDIVRFLTNEVASKQIEWMPRTPPVP